MKTYDTSDFQLAVTLYSLGYELLNIDKSNPRRMVFKFEYEPRINETVGAFFGDSLTINPRLIFTNTRLVKSKLYTGV